MTDQNHRSKSCRMERIGLVVDITDDRVRLEVEGKPVTVPRIKTAEYLELGDRVSWNGKIWVKIREEEVKKR
ncbi:hypothetical protein [Paenibacillus sp. JDR-2]|uniref:hypothetical protein n=1 Tax=Paenibacillus sp. (strain JDR-2) TaxID=324057 RepID=UPI000166BC22|nr:hypothetical protein [Paenibacillus sp. JDR-2]ACT01940.1 hypothetical protein Pjdr2_3304 [Paenibacillus sp. JDR-2]